MENELSKIAVEVFETTNWKIANEYLKLGWVLFSTYTTCYNTMEPLIVEQTMHYCLGWSNTSKEPVHPKPKIYPGECVL